MNNNEKNLKIITAMVKIFEKLDKVHKESNMPINEKDKSDDK